MKKQAGFAFLSILLTVLISALLYYFIMKNYSTVDTKTQNALAKQGIDTSDYKKMVNTMKDKIDEINKKTEERGKQWQEIGK